MKGIIKFLIRWLVSYIAGAGLFVGIVYFAFAFFKENEGLLVATIIVGALIIWFIWVRKVVGLLNRWLERW